MLVKIQDNVETISTKTLRGKYITLEYLFVCTHVHYHAQLHAINRLIPSVQISNRMFQQLETSRGSYIASTVVQC